MTIRFRIRLKSRERDGEDEYFISGASAIADRLKVNKRKNQYVDKSQSPMC